MEPSMSLRKKMQQHCAMRFWRSCLFPTRSKSRHLCTICGDTQLPQSHFRNIQHASHSYIKLFQEPSNLSNNIEHDKGILMKDQHQHIKGYRDFDQSTVDLINKIKEKGSEIETLLNEVKEANADPRWHAVATTDLQKGFMALVRSVAKPQSFA